MINFSTLQGLSIPEGVVTQITDASGRVLWSAVKNVTLTIDIQSVYKTSVQSITVNGVTYNTVGKTVLSVPIGTEIVCKVDATECECGHRYSESFVYLNDSKVLDVFSTSVNKSYTYVVTGNVTVSSVGSKTSGCTDCEDHGDEAYGYGATIIITEE